MVLKNMKCPPKVLRAVELLRFCTPNGCSCTAPSLSSFVILSSRGVRMQTWLFWKHSALFCVKDLRKKPCGLVSWFRPGLTLELNHDTWAKVQVRVLRQDSSPQPVLKRNMRNWALRDHSSGCHCKWPYTCRATGNAAEPLRCATDTFLPKHADYIYFSVVPTTSFNGTNHSDVG